MLPSCLQGVYLHSRTCQKVLSSSYAVLWKMRHLAPFKVRMC